MRNSVQVGLLALIIGFVGATVVQDNVEKKPTVVSASPVENEVHSVISSMSLQEKEITYKIFKGIADYCENVRRIKHVYTVSSLISEVFISYKMEGHTELDPLITKKLQENGVQKDSLLKDSYQGVIKAFNDLSEGTKYSIEQSKKDEKK